MTTRRDEPERARTIARRALMVVLAALGVAMIVVALTASAVPATDVTTASTESPSPIEPRDPTPRVVPTALPRSTLPAVRNEKTRPASVPLELLSADAAQLAAASGGELAVVVLVPAEGVAYEWNGDDRFPLLSVSKVPIMLALMDQATAGDRELSRVELQLLDKMIRESSNDAADSLWRQIGGASRMRSFLASVGLDRIVVPDSSSWGDTTATPLDTAWLLAKLVEGEILNEPMRALALGLMSTVSPWQDWGALAGVLVSGQTGVKNGWYPEREGWQLNSVGFVRPVSTPSYVIAIFGTGYPDMATGIATIERIGVAINAAMAGARPTSWPSP